MVTDRTRMLLHLGARAASAGTYALRKLPRNRLRILMYHQVADLDEKRCFRYRAVTPAKFEAQMRYLSEGGFQILSLSEGIFRLQCSALPEKAVSITFDDGYANIYTGAYPVLQRYRLCATVFLVGAYVGTQRPFRWVISKEPAFAKDAAMQYGWYSLSYEQIAEMRSVGITFGSHTLSHRPLRNTRSPSELSQEIAGSKHLLENRLGFSIPVFSYPYGTNLDTSEEVVAIVKQAGYSAACTTSLGSVAPGDDLWRLKRIPVYQHDSLREFKKKLLGAYDGLGLLANIWRRWTEPQDKPWKSEA